MVKALYWCGEVKPESLFMFVMVLDILMLLSNVSASSIALFVNPVYIFNLIFAFCFLIFAIFCLAYYFKKDTYHTKMHLVYFAIKVFSLTIYLVLLIIAIVFNVMYIFVLMFFSVPLLLQFWWSYFLFLEIKAGIPEGNSYEPVKTTTAPN